MFPQLTGNSWNVESVEDPIIHVTANYLIHYTLRIASVFVAVGERGLIWYFVQDWVGFGISFLDIIYSKPVIWVDPHIAFRM
jgi:hypothetical protein